MVEEELNWLEKGVLVMLDHSEWATPIVSVPKKDGRIHICGDYNVTKPSVRCGSVPHTMANSFVCHSGRRKIFL